MSMILEEKCIHHWVIESAESTYSRGKCKKCNKESVFENSLSAERKSAWALDSQPKHLRNDLVL